MKIIRAYKTELDPNNKQRTSLLKHAGSARKAFNWGLERRIKEYEETKKSSNAIDQHKQLNVLKKTEFPWMYEVSKCAMQEALRDLDKAYNNFFRRVAKGQNPGFPKFKSRRSGKSSFRLTGSIIVSDKCVQLPRIGKVKLKESKYIPTDGIRILSATVSEKAGRWFVSIQCEATIKDSIKAVGKPVGVDLGLKSLAVCSNGQTFENPKTLRKNKNKLSRSQRELSRRTKGGKNREKSKRRVAKIHFHIANIRKDTLHKTTSSIIKAITKPSCIVLEDLNVSGMLKNHNLAYAISDVGWGEFYRQSKYKSEWNAVDLYLADRFYPSTKTCHLCDYLNNDLTLDDREWTCPKCGTHHDRDFNASKNLEVLPVKHPNKVRRVPPKLGVAIPQNVHGDCVRLTCNSNDLRSGNPTSIVTEGKIV